MTNLSPNLKFLAIWFCSSGLKQSGKFHSDTLRLKNTVAWYFYLKCHSFVPQKLRMTFLEMETNKKMKLSVSSTLPRKYEGTFFLKKLIALGNKLFRANLWRGFFTWGLMIRSCQEKEKDTVNRQIFPGHGGSHTWK